jgi:hypothetical protein
MSTLKVSTISPLGTDATKTITVGASGDTFTVTDGVTVSGAGANTPAFSAYLSSAQSISVSTWTKVAFNAEFFDTNSAFDTSNNRFTVPSNLAGKYCFIGQINMEYIDDNKTFRMSWYKNGSSFMTGTMLKSPGANGSFIYQNTTILDLTVGDYIELYGYTDNSDTNVTFQDGGSPYGSTGLLGYKLIGA